nr:hypothetical protein [Tanacetum cinerariifolium]
MLHPELTSRISVKNTMRTSCQSLRTRFAMTSEKEVHARLDFGKGSTKKRIREGSHYSSARTLSARAHLTDLAKLTRQVQPSPDRTGKAPGIVLAIEAALTGGTLLMEIVPRVENAPVASGNHITTRIPPMGPTTDIAILTETAPADGETIEDFMVRFKVKTGLKKGAPECMMISGFMHGVNNPELTKRLNEHVPKTMEEIMITITAFIRGEAAAAGKRKATRHGEHRTGQSGTLQRRGKFQPPPPMVTPLEKRSSNKFCDFYNDKGHNTDECMQLKKQIEELVRAAKLSHLIKEIKQGWDQSKVGKKEAPAKDKPMAIYMIQSWQRMTRQKVTQSFERVREIRFPSLATSSGTKGPLVIEAEIGEHMIHRMYVDGGSSTKALGNNMRRRSFYKSMENFMIVRSLSPYNGIIGRPGIKEIQAVPSTAHEMFKFSVDEGIVTIRSTILIPAECATVITSSKEIPKEPSDMTGVPRSVAEHRLNIREGYSPVRQKKRGQAPKRAKAIQVEVQKLVEAGIMRGVYYHDWVSNPVMIQLAELDEEKTAFHTSQGVYCYIKMPFGLKNSGATYQRLVDKAFDNQIVEKSLPLFKTLKKCIKKSDFHWTSEAEQAFNQLKQHLSELSMLVAPRPKEELIVYLPASYGAISAVLITEKGTVQKPVYFVSRALQGPELNYTPMEKLVLSLVFAAKRLRRYFQAHPVAIITDQPIKQIMSHPDVAGRLQKWSVILREHNITYRPRTSVKGQVLADFLAEMSDESPPDASVVETQQELWTHFTNGSSCVDGSGAGLILTSPEGTEFTYALRFQAYAAKEENMIKYLEKVKSLVSGFANFSINQVPRSKNKKAGALSKITSTSFAHLSIQVLVEILKEKSIQEKEVTTVVEEDGPTWMTPIIEYLKEETLPGDRKEARKLRIKARQYELLEGVLYRRSFLTPWLRCVGPLQADYVIREIHEGSCSMHARPRSVVAKAIRLGYYWPTMHRDARDMIRTCKVKFLIVAINYFTKWIEAKAVATITGNRVKKFVWDNIVCRFGLLGEIVSDNDKQFSDNPFKDWCDKLNITQRFASVRHPQSNGLVERANRSLGEGIKARLGEGNKNWIEENPHVLWAHRTMIKSRQGDTPFSLTYETEAIIPAEIGMPTYRTVAVDVVYNDEELQLNLDLLEE